MQLNIHIEDVNLQEQLTQYISKKQIEANDLLVELLQHFFNEKKNNNNFQLSKEVTQRVKNLMTKHNVQVSF